MSNGIDWFRWHHGSATDPKFQLIAKQCGSNVAEVIGLWAFFLEAASMNAERGVVNEPDFESIDCALGLTEGKAQCVYTRMQIRGLIDQDGQVCAWHRRQPKREDDKSTDRVRRFRERKHELELVEAQGNAVKRSETQGNEVERPGTLEESREENTNTTPPRPTGAAPPCGLGDPAEDQKVVSLKAHHLIQDGVTIETANEFLAMRKSKRAKLTPRAWEGIKAEVDKVGWELEAALLKCLSRGWQSFDASYVTERRAANSEPELVNGVKKQFAGMI